MELTAVKNLSSGGGLKVDYVEIPVTWNWESMQFPYTVMDGLENSVVFVENDVGNMSLYTIVSDKPLQHNITRNGETRRLSGSIFLQMENGSLKMTRADLSSGYWDLATTLRVIILS